MPTNRIKTVLIEDSSFMRKVISDIISTDAEIELIGTAADGKEGAALAFQLKPDVVITDMVMPQYDGMYVVKSLMESHPIPIILLSSLEKSNTRIFDALQYGAFEFVDKPSDVDMVNINKYPLVELIKQASRTDISVLKAKQSSSRNTDTHTFDGKLNYEIVVIGSSTGGPGALELIINNLPKNLKIPVVIAQHMPARFLETFAARLNETSGIPVKLAQKGEVLRGGVIYIAPGENNLRVERGSSNKAPSFNFTNNNFPEFNNPSINCLFNSVAETYGKKSIGVILTGMGKDGAAGLLKIKQNGGYTIAQDEESCVVYGMPKSAYELGAVKQVVPLKQISGYIISCL